MESVGRTGPLGRSGPATAEKLSTFLTTGGDSWAGRRRYFEYSLEVVLFEAELFGVVADMALTTFLVSLVKGTNVKLSVLAMLSLDATVLQKLRSELRLQAK